MGDEMPMLRGYVRDGHDMSGRGRVDNDEQSPTHRQTLPTDNRIAGILNVRKRSNEKKRKQNCNVGRGKKDTKEWGGKVITRSAVRCASPGQRAIAGTSAKLTSEVWDRR